MKIPSIIGYFAIYPMILGILFKDTFSDRLQELAELLCGFGPVADFVFLFIAHFGKSLGVAFGYKDGVVSESGCTFACLDDFSLHNPFEQVLLAVDDNGKNRVELCFTVFYAFQLMQQFLHIGFRVVCVACIAGRINSRSAVQRFYFESGIVGKTVQMVVFVDVPCF